MPKSGIGSDDRITTRRRKRLLAGEPAIRELALSEFKRRGPKGSRHRWWAFEGFTSVDCWFETDQLVLFIEGKRTEKLSGQTRWMPARDQLTRNLELVGLAAPPKPGFVLLAVEQPVEEPDPAGFKQAAPHLGSDAASILMGRYLGQLSWRAICELTGFDYASLPDKID